MDGERGGRHDPRASRSGGCESGSATRSVPQGGGRGDRIGRRRRLCRRRDRRRFRCGRRASRHRTNPGNTVTGEVCQRDEQVLIERARQGDAEAFGGTRLEVPRHRAHVGGAPGFRSRPCARWHSEALIRAWRAMRFAATPPSERWLHRITVNTAWTMRSGRPVTRPLNWIESIEDPESGPEHPACLSGPGRPARALEQPTPGQRTVLVLRDVYGWTHAEVSREFGITRRPPQCACIAQAAARVAGGART